MLKQIVRKMRPDILIVSGDLANQPVPWQMKKAARVVREIEEECAREHPLLKTIVFPGNHDFKYWGNVGLRRITRVPFEIYFRRDGLDRGFSWRCGQAWKLGFKALWWKNQEMREPVTSELFPGLGVAVFVLNSNSLSEMMAGGKVESDNLQQLYADINRQDNNPEFSFLYKIAAVHHHPAPIADAPAEALDRLQDTFMVFYNAGLILRELSRRHFNLVLHGHKHVAGFLRISCEFPELGRTELPVAAAGSASHPDPYDSRGNHLHLLEIYDDDTACLTSRFFSADVEEKAGSYRYQLDTLADVRRRRYAVFRTQQNYSCRQLTKTVEITSAGYSNIEMEFHCCTAASKEGLDSIPLSLTAGRPGYLRGVDAPAGASKFLEIEHLDKNPYAYKGSIHLGQHHTRDSGLFDYRYCYRLMNGQTLTAEEFARHYAGTEITSEYASITCDGAFDQLVLNIGFPAAYDIGRLEFQATAEYVPAPLRGLNDPRLDRGEAVEHDEETARIRGYLKAGVKPVVFTCPDPVPGMIYKVCWRFLEAAKPSEAALAAAARIDEAKSRLLAIAEAAKRGEALADWNRARSILNALAADISGRLHPAATREALKISAMVYDEKKQRLRFVCANTDPDDMPTMDFISGEGCAGFAFEKARYLLYHPQRDPKGYFLHNDELKMQGLGGDPVAMASFPWIDEGLAVGVVNVSSHIPTTKMLALFDAKPAEQEAVMKVLQDVVNLGAQGLLTI